MPDSSEVPAEVAEAVDVDCTAAKPSTAMFLPISLKSPRVEIELPHGGVLRLPYDIGQSASDLDRQGRRLPASLEGTLRMIDAAQVRSFLCALCAVKKRSRALKRHCKWRCAVRHHGSHPQVVG